MRVGGRPGARLAPPPSPPTQTKEPWSAAGRVPAAPSTERESQRERELEGRAPSPGVHRPRWLLAGFGPATWGYWSSSRSRDGGQSPLAEGSRGARPRGQSAAGAAAASPPRFSLVWFGPAHFAVAARKVQSREEGVRGTGVGCGNSSTTPLDNFSPIGARLRLSTPAPALVNPLRAVTSARLARLLQRLDRVARGREGRLPLSMTVFKEVVSLGSALVHGRRRY